MGKYIFGGEAAPSNCGGGAANVTLAAALGASDDAHKRYTRGVNQGSLGQALAAGVQLAFSFATPFLVRKLGLRATYALCFVVFVGAFLGMGLLPRQADASWSPTVAIALMALTGIPLAATNIFPFAIIGRLYNDSPFCALYMGALNVFIVLPQILDTSVLVTIIMHFLNWNAVLLAGAVWALLALASVWLLPLQEDGEERELHTRLVSEGGETDAEKGQRAPVFAGGFGH